MARIILVNEMKYQYRADGKRLFGRALPLFVAATALLGLTTAACGGDDDGPGGGRPLVLAATVQVEALARVVAGEDAEVTTVLKAGVDPHDYELTAGDRKAVERATVILRNGVGLDGYLDSAITGKETRAKTFVVTEGIPLRVVDGEADPHVWQNPLNVKVMVENTADALSAKDPGSEAGYRDRAAAYLQRLDEVDREIAALMESIPPANRKMVTNHDAFGYFIERYGLEFVGAVIPSLSTQAEPSAKDIAALQDLVRREGVKAIFAESSLDPKVATQLAKDTGVKIVDDLYGDSLGEPGSGAETVDGMLLANARKIAGALK